MSLSQLVYRFKRLCKPHVSNFEPVLSDICAPSQIKLPHSTVFVCLVVDKNIFNFNISVHDPVTYKVLQSFCNLLDNVPRIQLLKYLKVLLFLVIVKDIGSESFLISLGKPKFGVLVLLVLLLLVEFVNEALEISFRAQLHEQEVLSLSSDCVNQFDGVLVVQVFENTDLLVDIVDEKLSVLRADGAGLY